MFSTRPILSPNSFGALHPQFDVTPMSVTSHSHRRAQLQLYSTSAFLPFEKTIKVGYKLTLTNSYYLVCKKAIYKLYTTSWYVCKKHTILQLPIRMYKLHSTNWQLLNVFFGTKDTILQLPIRMYNLPTTTWQLLNGMFWYETYNLISTNSSLQISYYLNDTNLYQLFHRHTNWSLPTVILRLPTRVLQRFGCPLRHRVRQQKYLTKKSG